MFNLKKEVVHHAACKFQPPVSQQTADNKITIPSIHFIETSARHDILIFQIKQSWRLNGIGVRFPQLMNNLWQMRNRDLASMFHLAEFPWFFETRGQIKHRRSQEFRIGNSA